MTGTPSSSAIDSSAPPLPPGFKTIEEIQNIPNHKIMAGELVSLIGFVKDYQPPMATRGTDWKCTLEVKDPSIQYSSYGLKIIIFSPQDKMPKIYGVGDVLLIRKIKVQMYYGCISLLKNQATEIYVLPASKIPRGPSEVPNAPWQSFPALLLKPNHAETTYVAMTATGIGEMSLPSNEEFQQKTTQALNIKDKFSLLKDVKPEGFYDILGEVIRIFDGSAGRVTVYLSDFTANSFFYEYTWKEDGDTADHLERDEYGNNKIKTKAGKAWPGPYGKMSLQLTLFDAHADFVRANVKDGQWIIMRNVQMRFGKMGGCLEGFLRGDPRQFESAVRIEIMEQKEEKGKNDTRWTDAVRRKFECEKKFKKQKQAFLDEAAGLGEKRKRDDEPPKSNAKKRRKERLAAAARKAAAVEAKVIEKLDLNENLRCSHPDKSTMSIPSILKPQKYLINRENDQEINLPFVVANYKANVRVVGYFPSRIEDFAVGRRVSEYDILSDYSGGEDTDTEEFKRSWASGRGAPKKVWEWRFALEVEDAGKNVGKDRMWLMVDNASAQGLLDMDAVNLRSKDNRETFQELKEKLCILWGDLEERNSALTPPDPNPEPKSSFTPSITTDIPSSPPNREAGAQPSLDSEDENDYVIKEPTTNSQAAPLKDKDPNVGLSVNGKSAKTQNPETQAPIIRNKAFTCCIKQYGVKAKEEDPNKATAGEGKRWERKFGFFGVVIA